MKHLFSSVDSGQVGFIRSVLDVAEIPFEVRNEAVSQSVAGTFPFAEEIWVSDEDYDEAKQILDASRETQS